MRSPFEKLSVPNVLPLERPNAQNRWLLKLATFTGRSKVTLTSFNTEILPAFRVGDIDWTISSAHAAEESASPATARPAC